MRVFEPYEADLGALGSYPPRNRLSVRRLDDTKNPRLPPFRDLNRHIAGGQTRGTAIASR